MLQSSFPSVVCFHWCCVPWLHAGGPALGGIFIPSTGSLAGPSDLKTRDLQLWETHLCHLSNNFLLSTSSLLELLLIRGWTSWIDFLNFLFFPPTVQFIVCVLFFLKGLILYSDSSGLFFFHPNFKVYFNKWYHIPVSKTQLPPLTFLRIFMKAFDFYSIFILHVICCLWFLSVFLLFWALSATLDNFCKCLVAWGCQFYFKVRYQNAD